MELLVIHDAPSALADGLDHGRTPVPELIPLRVAQATRGYAPSA